MENQLELDVYSGDLKPIITEVDPLLIVRPEIKIFGKIAHQNRSVGFFSNESVGYKYSNQIAKSIPLTPGLVKLLDEMNKKYGAKFNGILVNKYDGGSDYIGAHSDDESGLDQVGVIAISYGAVRKFRIRNKKTKEIIRDVPTESNGIIFMKGDFQKNFTHEIPIEKTVSGIRYSLTFRSHSK
jgi:alkylated DNA repair dioxygenase AlkB